MVQAIQFRKEEKRLLPNKYFMTEYKVVYEIANRVKEMKIEATSPMEAFKKFKKIMPVLLYKNASLHEIVETDVPVERLPIRCYPCNTSKFL